VAIKKKRAADSQELDLIPIMNMVTILIPFLLMASSFVNLAVIDSTLPAIGAPTEADEPDTPPLNLKVLVTSEGFTIATDVAVLPSAASDGPTVPCRQSGCPGIESYDFEALTALLSTIKDEYSHEENVILVPESHIRYDIIIMTMDATREDPSQKVQYTDDQSQTSMRSKELFPYVVIAGGGQ
jgi:biopolymer transport protein ExbD